MPGRLADLIGRAMSDPEFLAELQRAPEPILAQYELDDDERSAVRRAISSLSHAPTAQRAHVFGRSLLRRVST